MANEKVKEHIKDVLRDVSDNLDEYLPQKPLLEGREFVVRYRGVGHFPTVELCAEMPVLITMKERSAHG